MIPTDYTHKRPAYKLVVNGTDITPTVNGRLVQLSLTESRGMEADRLSITLSDHDGKVELPPTGAEIELAMGWKDDLVEKGLFTVDEAEHSGAPDQVRIRAKSADMKGDLPGKKSRSWDNVTMDELVSTIASDHDLTPKVGESLKGIVLEHLDQTSESDLHLLTRLAERHDAIAAVKGGNLLFVRAGQGTTASGDPIPPRTVTRKDGDNHRYSETDREAYSGVIAFWNDPDSGERTKAIAGTEENPKELRATYATEDDALAAARSELSRIQRGAAEFSFTLAHGDPELAPETPLILEGWKEAITAKDWIAVEVSHDLSDSALGTSVQCELTQVT